MILWQFRRREERALRAHYHQAAGIALAVARRKAALQSQPDFRRRLALRAGLCFTVGMILGSVVRLPEATQRQAQQILRMGLAGLHFPF